MHHKLTQPKILGPDRAYRTQKANLIGENRPHPIKSCFPIINDRCETNPTANHEKFYFNGTILLLDNNRLLVFLSDQLTK